MGPDDHLWDAATERLIETATAEQGISLDALFARVAAELRVDEDSDELDHAFEYLLDEGEIALLAGDVVVACTPLLDGTVFTHVLTDDEIEAGFVAPSADLAPIVALLGPWSAADGLTPLEGPLEEAAAGATVAVAVSTAADGDELTLGLQVVEHAEPAPALATAFRASYEKEVAEPGLPVGVEELVWHALLADRHAFTAPRPPLSALCAQAGLELRGHQVADDPAVWRRGRLKPLFHAVFDNFRGDTRLRGPALAALQALEDDFAKALHPKAVFDAFARRPLLEVFREVLVDEAWSEASDPLADAERLAEVLEQQARKPQERAIASYWAAAVLEGRRRPGEALKHLEESVRQSPELAPAVERLAWYRSDMGDAEGAIRLLSRIADDDERVLTTIDHLSEYSGRAAARSVGRNDPCWCGSGRKYKVCHLGKPNSASLPDRVSWLLEKMLTFAEHNSSAREGTYDIIELLAGLGAGRSEFAEAAGDPLVPDTLFFGLDRIRDFFDLRGELLPADERALVESWLDSRRTLIEIESVEPGVGMQVKDLRTAERYDVRERTFTEHAQTGTVWCARVVPDGESHQLIFGLWPIPAGTEGDWLDMLDRDDPWELLVWRRDSNAPPALQTTEGEALVECIAEFEVAEADALRASLDALFERGDDEDRWVDVASESRAIPGGRLIRANLTLDGSGRRLEVTAMSRERFERVFASVVAIDGVELVNREETELTVPRRAAAPLRDVSDASDAPPEVTAALEEWRDRHEERWCDEPVPALGGMTPRQAAADPAARETLERLLLSFPEPPEGVFATRPSRLRELLDL